MNKINKPYTSFSFLKCMDIYKITLKAGLIRNKTIDAQQDR